MYINATICLSDIILNIKMEKITTQKKPKMYLS